MQCTTGLVAALLMLGAAAPMIIVTPAAAQAESAEIAFWNSIRESKNRAEYEAYLQAFPKGVFAPLARVRMQQLGGNISAPAQQKSAPASTFNRQNLSQIQTKLYNLNYDLKRYDGVMDEATRDAIREWQERIGAEATGALTNAQFQRLTESRPPAIWGSIAYTANGTIGRAWNRTSRKDAEESAMAECRRLGGRDAECSTQSAGDAACVAVATYNATIGETVYFGARVSLKPQLQEAVAAALEQCERAERSNGTCASKTSLCADGSHDK